MNQVFIELVKHTVSLQYQSVFVGGLVGILYLFLLFYHSRNNKLFFRTLLVVAIATAVVYFVADISVLYSIVGGGKFNFTVLALAVFHTLELFIFQTHFFDNGYNDFFFVDDQVTALIPWSGETYAYIYVTAFVLACITSSALVIMSPTFSPAWSAGAPSVSSSMRQPTGTPFSAAVS